MAFTKSSELQAADKAVSDWQTKKPGDYVSNYKSQIDDLLNKITNREKFAYNFGTDPIYNQYKNQYTEAGKKAAEDVQAQSAALSGGFGNSYGATAASQQYQNYLGKLNNIIPDLQNNAFNKYQAEGTELQNKLASLQNAEQSDYAKYQNNVNDYYNQLNALTNYANNLYNREYAQYQAAQAAAASRSSGSGGSGKTSNNTNYKSASAGDRYYGAVSGSSGLTPLVQAKANVNSLKTSAEKWDYIKKAYDAGSISTSTYLALRKLV